MNVGELINLHSQKSKYVIHIKRKGRIYFFDQHTWYEKQGRINVECGSEEVKNILRQEIKKITLSVENVPGGDFLGKEQYFSVVTIY